MKKLLYLPIERYKSRYSEYVSGSCGMFARCVEESDYKIELEVIAPDSELHELKSGVVVDTVLRTKFSSAQVNALLEKIEAGAINSESIIYIEDFWLAAMEMIPYACHLKGINPKIYAFVHAQSVDKNDFSYGMRDWMRHFEIGWAKCLTGIFVAAPELKAMLVEGGVCEADKIHVTGTVMNRQLLIDHYCQDTNSVAAYNTKRQPTVLFTSRTDPEKNPEFFIALAKECRDWRFMMLSGKRFDSNIAIKANAAGIACITVDKENYFRYLASGSVMLNAADQDFVSYGLLDAMAVGCLPLLPNYLTFPAAVGYDQRFLYEKGNMSNCIHKLKFLMETAANTAVFRQKDPVPSIYKSYGTKYEKSVNRMLGIMMQEQSL